MDKKVYDLIIDIIGNGASCSNAEWISIRKALKQSSKHSHNQAIPTCLCKSCGKELASYLIDDNTFNVEIEHECSHSDTSA